MEISMALTAGAVVQQGSAPAPSLAWWLVPLGLGLLVIAMGVALHARAQRHDSPGRPTKIGVRLTEVVVDGDAVLLGYQRAGLRWRLHSALKEGSEDSFGTILLDLGPGSDRVVGLLYRWQHDRARLSLRTSQQANVIELQDQGVAHDPITGEPELRRGLRCRAL